MAPRPLPRAAISASSSSFVSCLLPAPRSAVSCSSRRAAVSQSGVSPGGAKLRICHFSPRRSEGAARPELGRAGAGASSSRGRAPAAVEWRCRERRKPAAGEKTCQVWFIMENTLLRLFFLDHGSLDLLRLVKAVGKNMGCLNYKQKMVSFQQRALLSLPFRLFISFVLLLGSCASPC